jgi:VCBS repeat protein
MMLRFVVLRLSLSVVALSPAVLVAQVKEPAPPAQDASQSAAEPVWLRDSSGREYSIEKLPKNQAQKIDRNRIQTIWGIPMDIVSEDAEFYYFKSYKPGKETGPVVRTEPPTGEQVAAIDALYRSAIGSSDRLAFVPFDEGLPRQGQWRDGFAIGDMNEDGHLDLVFGPPRKSLGGPVIFLGDGTGKWTRWKDVHFAPRPYDYGTAAVADLNGDGHMDIVFGVHLHGLIALLGDGKGNFSDDSKGLEFAQPGHGAGFAFSSRAIAIADWDGDGRPDIVALGEGPRLDLTSETKGIRSQSMGLIVYLNQKDGGWRRLDLTSGAGKSFGDSIAVADFNGDGKPDVATGSMMMGRRDILMMSGSKNAMSSVDLDVLRPNILVRSVAAADFDGDGKMDLVIAYTAFEEGKWRSAVDVLYQIAPGRFSRETLGWVMGNGGPTAVATGDLDGDGIPDIVTGTAEGEVWVFLGGHGVTFSREHPLASSFTDCAVTGLLLRDLDGDKRDEIVASFATESESDDVKKCSSQGGVAAWSPRPSRHATPDIAPR